MANDDAWATSTGLYTDYEGVVEEASFGTDARYNNGESTLLFWKVRPTNIDITTDDGLIEVSFGAGTGWFSYDGGETIEHSEGKGKVNSSAIYGKLVDWAIEQGLADTLKEKGSPLEAKVWVGLAFRFEEVEFNYGKEIGTKKRVMPVEVMNSEDVAVPNTKNADSSKDDLEGFKEELTALAENSPTAESFTESAMGLTDITDHANLVMQIADGTLYETLKG